MKRSQPDELARLAGMKRDRALARVEQVVQQMNRISADIEAIRALGESQDATATIDAARLAGADRAWAAASEAQIARLQQQLAGLRVAHEQVLAEARSSFGRAEAAKEIAALSNKDPRSGR